MVSIRHVSCGSPQVPDGKRVCVEPSVSVRAVNAGLAAAPGEPLSALPPARSRYHELTASADALMLPGFTDAG